jgi:hypothetical protein
MIGRCDQESSVHATAAARAGGWHDEPLPLLNLGTLDAALHSVAYLGGLEAVVRLGQPHQPDPLLEQALLAAPPGVAVTGAQAVDTEWTWVSRSTQVSSLLVDNVAYQDCRAALEAVGVPFRVIPVETTVAERVALCSGDGSLLIEAELAPEGWHRVPVAVEWNHRIWFGRCTQPDDEVAVGLPKILWVAFAPVEDRRGSLVGILELLGSLGFDLVHLRSFELRPAYHIFFAAFVCDSVDALTSLRKAFTDNGIRFRILAALDQPDESDTRRPLLPSWGA